MGKTTTPRTTVVNVKHEPKGSYVYIGRAMPGLKGSMFANQYRSKTMPWWAIDMYRKWFLEKVATDADFRAAVLALAGQRLGCWCAPEPCHGDVIADWIEVNSPEAARA